MADHYAALGLAPYAEHSAIRAAYLALMRRYHPDMNSSVEAAARAREVTAAYEVLGNPDSRTDYDLARARAHAAMDEGQSRGWRSPQALGTLASVGGVALLSLLYLMPPAPADPVEEAPVGSTTSAPRQRDPVPARSSPAATKPANPVEALPSPAPLEIARAPAPVKVAPAPPPIEVKRVPVPVAVKRAALPATTAPSPPRMAPRRPVARANNAAELVGLDRHLGMLLRQSVRRADAAKQQSLYRDHYRFIARLNACSTEGCKRSEYLGRMGEIGRAMAAPAKPRANPGDKAVPAAKD